jgi:chromosome segregation ATPase
MNAKKRGRPKKTKHIEALIANENEIISSERIELDERVSEYGALASVVDLQSKENVKLVEGIANLEKVNAYLADRIKDFEKSTVESAMKYSYWERDATAKQELIDSYLDQVDTLKSDARALESARSYWMGEAQKREEEIASLTKCLESITEVVKQKDKDYEATLFRLNGQLMEEEENIGELMNYILDLKERTIWGMLMRKLFGGKNGS